MKNKDTSDKKNISRREAMIKTGKYAAVTAAATFIILSPKKAQAQSPPAPGWGSQTIPTQSSASTEDKSSKA